MAKVKAHKFLVEEEDVATFELIGISSHVPAYKLVWDFNKTLNFELELSNTNFEVYSKKNNSASFPYYFQSQEEDFLSIYLIKNKHNGSLLIPELQQIDNFLFFVNNQVYEIEKINDALRKMNKTVLASYIFDPNEYSSVRNIIFE